MKVESSWLVFPCLWYDPLEGYWINNRNQENYAGNIGIRAGWETKHTWTFLGTKSGILPQL